MDYIIRAYKTQTIVLFFSILVLFVSFYIDSLQIPEGYKELGSPAFFSICWFLFFEIIVLPMNTLYLFGLKHINANIINIYSPRNIAIFAILYELIWCMNIHLLQDPGVLLWKLFLINYGTLTFIIVVVNIIVRINKSV